MVGDENRQHVFFEFVADHLSLFAHKIRRFSLSSAQLFRHLGRDEETKTPDAFLRADRCDLAEPSPSRAKARRATGEPALGAHLPKRDSLPP